MLNALTIDVEDWYHPELVRSRASPSVTPFAPRAEFGGPNGGRSPLTGNAGAASPQIEASTGALLDLLRQRGIKATFFVVGEIAQRYPHLIQAIAAEGHELGCHGMGHRPLWELTPGEFRSELEQFAAVMSSVVPAVDVIGFRAPTFSLDNRTRWALTILGSLGYHYDSSIFPVRTPVYGVSGGPLHPYYPSLDNVAAEAATASRHQLGEDGQGTLLEFPLTVWSWAGLRVPICGGFYLRALPLKFVLFALRQVNRQRPFVLYVHPWETFAGTPRLALPLSSRLITYYHLQDMMARLTTLLDAFSFAPMRTVLEGMATSRHPLGEGELSR
jgi:polysaccharide deacetylase family protein (PEP-CTERM system associated)